MGQHGIFIDGGVDPMEMRLRAMIGILQLEFGASADDILEATVSVLSQIDPVMINPEEMTQLARAASETVTWNVKRRQANRRRRAALELDD